MKGLAKAISSRQYPPVYVKQVFMKIPHYRIITARYLPCTDNKGSRISIRDNQHGNTKIIPYDASTDMDKQIVKYLNRCGIYVNARSHSNRKSEYYYLTFNHYSRLISKNIMDKMVSGNWRKNV